MDTAARVAGILAALKECYPDALCALEYEKGYELMIAVRLSAQCTDARVNLVTPALFARFDSLDAFADAQPEDVEPYIRSCGFFRAKARDIVLACRRLREVYGGRIPDTMEQLLKLPGVGRKTANVVMCEAFRNPQGIAVDTHVFRVSHRIGLADATTPDGVEKQLQAILPREEWSHAHHLLIWHGRRVCHARGPECDRCPLKAELCENGA